MNAFFRTGTPIIVAVAISAAICVVIKAQDHSGGQTQGQTEGQTQDQMVPPPPPPVATLPPNIVPGTPMAEVVKLVQAGVDVSTIQSYIANSQSAFNLDADNIVFLRDNGVPNEVVNAMMDRDKILYASTVVPSTPPTQAAPPPASIPDTTAGASPPDTTLTASTPDTSALSGTPDTSAPPIPPDASVPPNTPDTAMAPDTAEAASPPDDVNINYFYDTLTPYGSWVNVAGYGQCWRPTAVVYNPAWRPYCDRGRWVYTDCGWYWDSAYAWGSTFHYGRWFYAPRIGWCWYPNTVWAPSWVTWRSGNGYCGWAPLPPFSVYAPGVGFSYRGVKAGAGYNFGLAASSFVFLPASHFCDRNPGSFTVQPQIAAQIYHQTTVINNFSVSGKTVVNGGIAPDSIASATHYPIRPVHVGSLPNAGRQGWRGEGYQRPPQQQQQHAPPSRTSVENNDSGHASYAGNNLNGQSKQGAVQFNNANAAHYGSPGPAMQSSQAGGYQAYNYHPQIQNHPQSGDVNNVQSQGYDYYQQQPQHREQQPQQFHQPQQPQQFQPQQPRPYNTYNAADNGISQNELQQNRSYNNAAVAAPTEQRGARQYEQNEHVNPPQPNGNERQNFAEAGPRNYAQAPTPPPQPPSPPQNQPQQHSSGNGSGGGNNGNSGNSGNGSSNKQGH